jgi:endo-1,4-beta-xylanase
VYWPRTKNNWGVPPWQETLSDAELWEAVQGRAYSVTQHFKGRITEFDIINELLHEHFYRDKLGESVVDSMFTWVREGNPDISMYMNDFDIINGGGDYEHYRHQIDDLMGRGIPLDGIGMQGHFFSSPSENEINSALDHLAATGLDMKITELDVCGSENGQADKLELIMRTAFAHPSVTGIFLWGFWDGKQWRDCGLWAQDWSPKKAAQRYRALVFDEWWTDTLVVADATGAALVPAFYGEYAVRGGADSVTHSFTRQTENDTVTIGEPVAARPALMRQNRPSPAIRRVYTPGANQVQLQRGTRRFTTGGRRLTK